jgi:hypothetical protein
MNKIACAKITPVAMTLQQKKTQDKGLDFCTCQKKITNEKTLNPNPVVIPLVTALQRISKFS